MQYPSQVPRWTKRSQAFLLSPFEQQFLRLVPCHSLGKVSLDLRARDHDHERGPHSRVQRFIQNRDRQLIAPLEIILNQQHWRGAALGSEKVQKRPARSPSRMSLGSRRAAQHRLPLFRKGRCTARRETRRRDPRPLPEGVVRPASAGAAAARPEVRLPEPAQPVDGPRAGFRRALRHASGRHD